MKFRTEDDRLVAVEYDIEPLLWSNNLAGASLDVWETVEGEEPIPHVAQWQYLSPDSELDRKVLRRIEPME